MLDNGVNVPLFTSDGPWGDALRCGSLEGLCRPQISAPKQPNNYLFFRNTPPGTLMCAEFWVGWFDHWGCGKHNTTSAEDNAVFRRTSCKGSVNIYMFIGGTNFGFMNGANYYDNLFPDVTSYDYDALLTENGEVTHKYKLLRQVVSRYASIPEVVPGTRIKRIAYGECKLKAKVGLFESLDDLSYGIESTYPMSMERLGQNYGYILYRTTLDKEQRLESIRFYDANDRVNILLTRDLC